MDRILATTISCLSVGAWCYLTSTDKNTADAVTLGTVASPVMAVDLSTDKPDNSTIANLRGVDNQVTTSQRKSVKRLKIEVDVAKPEHLKVKEGQSVATNQLIAEHRQSERGALQAELDRVKLSIAKLRSTPKVAALPVTKVKQLKSTIAPNYDREEAEIATAKTKIVDLQRKLQFAQKQSNTALPEAAKVRSLILSAEDIQKTISRQQQKIDALATMEDVDKPIQEHEAAVLAKLKQSLPEALAQIQEAKAKEETTLASRQSKIEEIKLEIANAERDLTLAKSKLTAAVQQQEQAKIDRQIAENERQEKVWRAELERVRQSETATLQNHDREHQLAQLQLKKQQLERQIASITGITAPFAGTVKRVKLLSQNGHMMRYEVGLMYAQATVQNRADSIRIPQWQPD
jgi:DNA repair exonuclease SbcCD ATPase subunit